MSKRKTNIAVVDDDAGFARALSRLLRASGFDVETYASGEAFLVPRTLWQPDCLVLDIHLQGMSGLNLLRRIRELGSLTPVIFVTGSDAPEVREEAERAGCIAYLRKPVGGHALLEALAKARRPGGESASA